MICNTQSILINTPTLEDGKTDPERGVTARPGQQQPRRHCGHDRLDAAPSSPVIGNVAWALNFDWKMNVAASEDSATMPPGIRPRPSSWRRTRERACAFPVVLKPRVGKERSSVPPEYPAVAAKSARLVAQARNGKITVAYLTHELSYLWHWLSTRTALAIADMVLAVLVIALNGYERCRRWLPQRQPRSRRAVVDQPSYYPGGEAAAA